MGDKHGYSGRRLLSDKARRTRSRRNYTLSQVSRDCLLEDRTLLTVLATLDTHGLLSIALTSSNDAATVSEPNPSTLHVSGGTTNDDFPLASVQSIAAAGNNSSNQIVTFTGAVSLPGPLSATGVTSEILNGSYQVQSANLSASGTIDIGAGATLSSRQIVSGGNPLTAHSIGNSGNLTLTAPNIEVGDGARILADADNGSPRPT